MNDVLAYALLLSRDADSPEAGERDAAALLDLFGDKERLNAAVSELAGGKDVREDKGNLVPKKITDKNGVVVTKMVDPTKGHPAADTPSPSRPGTDTAPVPVDHAEATAEVAAMPGLSDDDRTGLVGAIKGIFVGGKKAVLLAKAVASAVHDEAKLWATRLALAGVTYDQALPDATELSNPLTGSTSATGGVDMIANATGIPGAQYALAKIVPKIAAFAILKAKSLLAGKRSESVDPTPDAEPMDRDELIRQFREAIMRAISDALTNADAEDDDPAEPDPVREARLLSENFTGRKKDSAGRMRCYRNGKLVPCPDLKAAATPSAKKGGTPAAPAKGPVSSAAKPGTGMPAPRPSTAKPAGGKKSTRQKMPEQPASEKAARAKATQVRTDAAIQRYAEEHVEPQFAKRMGGLSFPNSEPVDVAVPAPSGKLGHGVELKTMVLGKDEKLTMNAYAQVRKRVWREAQGVPFHTVVVDDRKVFSPDGNHDETERTYYYRRGIAGSARVMGMHKVEGGIEELKRIMAMTEDELPDAAKTKEKDWLTTGTWVPLPSGERGYVNTETGKEVRPKK